MVQMAGQGIHTASLLQLRTQGLKLGQDIRYSPAAQECMYKARRLLWMHGQGLWGRGQEGVYESIV